MWKLLVLLLLFSAGAALAQEGLTSVWIDASARLEESELEKVEREIATQTAQPDEIVFLVHGFAVPKGHSAKQFSVLAPRVKNSYVRYGKEVAVVGIGWDSEAKGFILFSLPGEYHRKTLLARRVGRYAFRQLLSTVKSAYPDSRVTIMAHSMGCELATAAVTPYTKLGKGQREEDLEIFQPERDLAADNLILCGSDLDFDVASRNTSTLRPDTSSFIWMTISEKFSPRRDKMLDLRAIIRGKAMGAAFPQMTAEQYDSVLQRKRIVFDQKDIPVKHSFLDYYSDDRLSRIVANSLHYHTSGSVIPVPEESAAIEAVMAAPDEVEALRPHLDSGVATLYALWRMEHLLCGGPHHLADGTLKKITNQLKQTPRKVRREHTRSRCEVVKQGYFPSEMLYERTGAPEWAR